MAGIKPGDQAPEFELQSADGRILTLKQSLLESDSVLLVFLRHLG